MRLAFVVAALTFSAALGLAGCSDGNSPDSENDPGGGGGGGGEGGGSSSSQLPVVGGCTVFTADDDWNRDISGEPADTGWTQKMIDAVREDTPLHFDFFNYPDDNQYYGMPINVVPASQTMVPVDFVASWAAEEGDPGPYPFPDDMKLEGMADIESCSGDCHALVVQQEACMLYEGYSCLYDGGWVCANGAVWDLTKLSYGQRTKGYTSADAAGLPIMPGLVRYDEVMAGEIRHAIRFTVRCTQPRFVKPATHHAVDTNNCPPDDPDLPPMGMRVRLKSTFDTSGFNPTARTILESMKKYGMILADNGGNYFFQGELHPDWITDDLEPLKSVTADQFEVLVPGTLER